MNVIKNRILVWDAPVRVFHWLLASSFLGAFLTAESESWRLLHVTLGYTIGILVVFRLLWGVVGTRYARFTSFVRGPRAVARYLGSLMRGRPEHHAGHNPAGAVAVLLLLGFALLSVVSGWLNYEDLGGEWLEEVHEFAGNFMMVLVGIHVAGVLVSSAVHRENLVRAMVTGRKEGSRDEGIRPALWPLAALLLSGVLGFWWWQWDNAPQAGQTPAVQGHRYQHDDD